MKKGNYYFALLALFSTALLHFACEPTPSTPQPDTAKDIEAVKAVLIKIGTDLNTGKPGAPHLSNYAEGFVIMPPGVETIASAEAEKKRYDAFISDNTYLGTIDAIDDVQISGDLAVIRYTVTEKATPKTGGDTTTYKSKGVYVMKRQGDGSWKVIIDIWNSN